ncbi:hypothetical protein Tco_0848420, partial [Tanacetum coccineum]
EKVAAVQCAFQIKAMPWCSRFCAKIWFAASELFGSVNGDSGMLLLEALQEAERAKSVVEKADRDKQSARVLSSGHRLDFYTFDSSFLHVIFVSFVILSQLDDIPRISDS